MNESQEATSNLSNCCAAAAISSDDVARLEGIRAHIGANALHWHKKAVDITAFVVGGSFAITSFALTRQVIDTELNYALAISIVILGLIGAIAVTYVRLQFYEQAGILRKIDEASGVFCPGHFGQLRGEFLYPEKWKISGMSEYKEPLVSNASYACISVSLALAIVLAVATHAT